MIVYEGPSMLNGEDIVAIITGLNGSSRNDKTGPMAQLWILPQEIPPHIAVQLGRDDSVCGDCPARGKWCYVTVFQAPASVYRSWKAGAYPVARRGRKGSVQRYAGLPHGLDLRLGAYGDPAALPLAVLEGLSHEVDVLTGYTHQWRTCELEYRNYCMASCDSLQDYWDAKKLGYRTFRVTESLSTKLPNESVCPASEEAGNILQCIDCGACDGRRRPRVKGDIVIHIHGTRGSTFDEQNVESLSGGKPRRDIRSRGRAPTRRRERGTQPVLQRTHRVLERGQRGRLRGARR